MSQVFRFVGGPKDGEFIAIEKPESVFRCVERGPLFGHGEFLQYKERLYLRETLAMRGSAKIWHLDVYRDQQMSSDEAVDRVLGDILKSNGFSERQAPERIRY